MEFHISRAIRERIDLDDLLFSFAGNVVFANVTASRKLAERLNALEIDEATPEKTVSGASLFAMGLIDELSHALIARYRAQVDPAALSDGLRFLAGRVGDVELDKLLLEFVQQFPNVAIFRNETTAEEWLKQETEGVSNREATLEELVLLWLANTNPAFAGFRLLFGDESLKLATAYSSATSVLPPFFDSRPRFINETVSLLDLLRAPSLASPDSLTGQLDYIREHWAEVLGDDLNRVLLAIDVLREEEIAIWMRFHPPGPVWHRHGDSGRSGEGFVGDEFIGFDDEFQTLSDGSRRRRYAHDYQAPLTEYEAFSPDQAWMPSVVLIAKNTYVWLEQLSKKYGRHISRLDQIPDEELHLLATRGMTGLWLIGLWERSIASRTIKRLRGNTDAVASAYSLKDYRIAEDLGGEAAYLHLRDHAAAAGLRLASDMVPNHMGIDSDWVIEHPEWFLSRSQSPFPVYRFDGPDVSTDGRVEIKIEDHYYDHSDAAVVFRLRTHRDGSTRYIYHGNDGTTFAWNDTAQLDYSKAEVREHVIQVILAVARRFPIIRFDAAMVLAKRHVQRLWFPLPGTGGSIPSRAEDAMSQEAFDALMPHEFWREVVDRVAVEVPGTLLLAEAFWLLEGYFVRTLGMHRVYNSAFMNMLRDEENAKYRSYLKKTVEFDPDILKRYVNFMSNPDEKTAIDQFGSGDKYFGVSMLLATLPGLPMFGHGQVEGFSERYGMDFKQARMDESPNEGLVARHQHLIAPLLKERHIFAGSEHFLLYDFWTSDGTVNENIFAYSNRDGEDCALILYNNSYQSTHGTVHFSVGFLDKGTGGIQQRSLASGLNLSHDDSIVITCTDNVLGLEYLFRAKTLRDQGFTSTLRGYQHIALLKWRSLQPTSAEPWDRLCDALNGAGVHSAQEALSALKLQPVIEALRATITASTIEALESLSRRSEASLSDVPEETAPPELTTGVNPPSDSASSVKAEADIAVTLPNSESEPRLETFFAHVAHFKQCVFQHLDSGAEVSTAPQSPPEYLQPSAGMVDQTAGSLEDRIAASLKVPGLVSALPSIFHRAAAIALPSLLPTVSAPQGWGPLVLWLVLESLSPRIAPLAAFDSLNLRSVAADTFAALGMEGEAAWRAAAQVNVQLKFASSDQSLDFLASEKFWRDPDVRWLAGVNRSADTEYLNQESFEELLCWMEVPALLRAADSSQTVEKMEIIAAELTSALTLLKQSGFEYERFISSACLSPLQEKTI
jgi:Glycosidases